MTARRVHPVAADFYVSSPFGPRWGSHHRGTDFGRNGGSAGHPVYAAQSGRVVHAGAASGFGGPDPAGWLVIDHPTADGSGTTVYGHIVRLENMRVGAIVEAGQQVGTINPNSRTNGGVAPHLHFEVHPTVWRPGSQIDPIPWLAAASASEPTGPIPAEVAHARPVVRRGSTGQHVRDLQERLRRDYPLYASHLVVDGDFGPATETVVREFQRRSNLQTDGVVGALTWKALSL